MEYLTSIKIPAQDKVLYGLPVSAMVRRGIRVQLDGKVKGRLFHVTGYTGFSKVEASGDYFPFFIVNAGKKMTFLKNGEQRFSGNFEAYNVLKVEPGQVWEIQVDGQTIAVFDFSQARFDEPKGESSMKASFFEPGACGLMTSGYIGTFDKNTQNQTDGVTFENALPVGARMVYLVAICSDDMTGATKITAGDGGANEDIYAKDHAITKGKGGAAHPDLPLIKSGTIKVKVDQNVTEGKIDIYATVVRLEV